MNTVSTQSHSVQANLAAENDNEEIDLSSLTSIEIKKRFGVKLPSKRHNKSAEERKKPQNAKQRQQARSEYEDALATVSRIEETGGPTLRSALVKSKTFQAAYTVERDRKTSAMRSLAQRAGLLRLMKVEFRTDFPREVSTRSLLYLDLIVQLSAAAAATSGSDWSSALAWLDRNLTALVIQIGEDTLHEDFDRRLHAAYVALATPGATVGPSAFAIAQALGTTTEQLRAADANQHHLTAIDQKPVKERDRARKEQKRRNAGMTPQTERTRTAELQAIADALVCSLRTVQRHNKAGTLETLIATKSGDVTKVSDLNRSLKHGQFCVTATSAEEFADIEASLACADLDGCRMAA